jgi:hypothetical protein
MARGSERDEAVRQHKLLELVERADSTAPMSSLDWDDLTALLAGWWYPVMHAADRRTTPTGSLPLAYRPARREWPMHQPSPEHDHEERAWRPDPPHQPCPTSWTGCYAACDRQDAGLRRYRQEPPHRGTGPRRRHPRITDRHRRKVQSGRIDRPHRRPDLPLRPHRHRPSIGILPAGQGRPRRRAARHHGLAYRASMAHRAVRPEPA